MLDYSDLFSIEPFSLDRNEKKALYDQWLDTLAEHHKEHCLPYARLVSSLGENPALPVRLFKEYNLRSIPEVEIVKTMTSSGTTGQRTSRIYLDRDTSSRQSKALSKIVTSFVGKKRPPMLIIDSRSVLKDRNQFSARGAGILGFSLLGRDCTYALDSNMNIDFDAVEKFCQRHAGEKVLLFGFTFIVWEQLAQTLIKENRTLELNGILIHGGGWKKLIDQQVSNEEFKKVVEQTCGVTQIHNYYGMVEQTGSIFMECEQGHLHASVFSDIDIINPVLLRPRKTGRGIIKCTSLLPTSFPGHILLTEDEGELLGEDDCDCGRKGKYFKIYGRMKGAEIRGCSDTYERN